MLTAVNRQDEETITETIMTRWILRFGAPKEIHVDCGKVFEGKLMSKLTKMTGARICFSSPYHHNTNGVIERQFRTIRDYINTATMGTGHKDWATILPDIEFTMNATKQKTVGKSPAEIIFGRKIYRECWTGQIQETEDKHRETLETVLTRRKFKIGDQVLVKVETRTKDKERYEGPYMVIKKIHDIRSLVQNDKCHWIERYVEKLR